MQKLVLKPTKILHNLSGIFNAVLFKLFSVQDLLDFRGQYKTGTVELIFENKTYACRPH
jgi:hypothetical protein